MFPQKQWQKTQSCTASVNNTNVCLILFVNIFVNIFNKTSFKTIMFIVENWKHEWALKKRAKIIFSLTTQRKPNQTLLCDTFILFPYHWAHWNVLRQGAVSQINTALIRWATIYRRQTVLRSCLSLKQTLYVRNFHCIFVWESWFYLETMIPQPFWGPTDTSVHLPEWPEKRSSLAALAWVHPFPGSQSKSQVLTEF